MKLDIKQLRKKADLTQMELARKIGVSLNTVVKWEKTPSKPSEENYKKLVKLFKKLCPASWVLE